MKLKTLITTLVFTTVFALSYFGVSYSRSTDKIAGEEVTVSSLTISSTLATCETVPFRNGLCDNYSRCVWFAEGFGDCSAGYGY